MPVRHQRAVGLSTVMQSRAHHFGSNQATAAEYELSEPCEDYSFFISHSWRASRTLKYAAFIHRFSLLPALAVTIATALSVTALNALGLTPTWRTTPTKDAFPFWDVELPGSVEIGFPATLCGGAVLPAVLFAWEHVAACLTRHGKVAAQRCFLDKLCIHQTDADLRQRGIDSIGSYLQNSHTMLLLWSPEYFTRLWCCFEIGVFLDSARLQRGSKRLEILPLCEAALAYRLAALHFGGRLLFEVVALYAGYLPAIACAAGTVCAVVLLPGLREEASARRQLSQQIARFRLADAQCAVESDRQLVHSVLGAIYAARDEARASSAAAAAPVFPHATPRRAKQGAAVAARFERRLRHEVGGVLRESALASHAPTRRTLALQLAVASFSWMDYMVLIMRVPAAMLTWEDSAEVDEQGGCAVAAAAWVRGAGALHYVSNGILLAWAYTVLLNALATLFPPRATLTGNVAAGAAMWVLLVGPYMAIQVCLRYLFYGLARCRPRLSLLFQAALMLPIVVSLAPWLVRRSLRCARAILQPGRAAAARGRRPRSGRGKGHGAATDLLAGTSGRTTAPCFGVPPSVLPQGRERSLRPDTSISQSLSGGEA